MQTDAMHCHAMQNQMHLETLCLWCAMHVSISSSRSCIDRQIKKKFQNIIYTLIRQWILLLSVVLWYKLQQIIINKTKCSVRTSHTTERALSDFNERKKKKRWQTTNENKHHWFRWFGVKFMRISHTLPSGNIIINMGFKNTILNSWRRKKWACILLYFPKTLFSKDCTLQIHVLLKPLSNMRAIIYLINKIIGKIVALSNCIPVDCYCYCACFANFNWFNLICAHISGTD